MIGKQIKIYLDENGIKQTFLADKAELTNDIVSGICKGTRKVNCYEYYKICKALNVPYEYFYQKWEEAQCQESEV